MKRVFLIVLDSVGIGGAPDAASFGDEGSNTLEAVRRHPAFRCPNLESLGLFHIEGVGGGNGTPLGAYGRMHEFSCGKDTTVGHWEIAGLVSEHPFPTYPNGFPDEIIKEFEQRTGRRVLCNRPYSGTDVIRDYGREHMETGSLIVYTSADSVFQIAAHVDTVPVEELYFDCEIARELLQGEHGVSRVIARPFEGEYPNYSRTSGRHDYSLPPHGHTMLDYLSENGYSVISVGKIYDIFSGRGMTESHRTHNNADGIRQTLELMDKRFEGLCFVNLVDFDMMFGHRNDVGGYAAALTEFDNGLEDILQQLKKDDLLIITADHGCDPSTPSTDHSREDVPVLVYGESIEHNVNLGVRSTYADIAATVMDYFGIYAPKLAGRSFWDQLSDDW